MKITNYKACLFDVDKTLTNSKREITKRTQDALGQLVEKNFIIGICSGRHFATLKSFALPFFPKDSLHIVSEGAQLIRSTGEIIWETLIPDEATQRVIEEAKKRNYIVSIPYGDTVYGTENIYPKNEVPVKQQDLAGLSYFNVPIIIVLGIEESFTSFLDTIPGISYKFLTSYSGRKYVDIMATGITKVTPFEQWCSMNKVTSNEVIGFGDSANDIEILREVGYSVAMGNADENLKKIADEVIGTSDEDGIAVWIETMLQNQ